MLPRSAFICSARSQILGCKVFNGKVRGSSQRFTLKGKLGCAVAASHRPCRGSWASHTEHQPVTKPDCLLASITGSPSVLSLTCRGLWRRFNRLLRVIPTFSLAAKKKKNRKIKLTYEVFVLDSPSSINSCWSLQQEVPSQQSHNQTWYPSSPSVVPQDICSVSRV